MDSDARLYELFQRAAELPPGEREAYLERACRNEPQLRGEVESLLAENSWGESATDYEPLKTPDGLRALSRTVDGIGPWIGQLVDTSGVDGQPVSTGLVSAAREAGLVVHPYTFRADQLAPGFETMGEMVGWFVDKLSIDGLFTDFPDQAIAALRRR